MSATTATTAATETLTADEIKTQETATPFTETVVSVGTPKLVITEFSAYPIQVEFASLQGADTVVRDTASVFEFIELHNYGTGALDLNDYALKITNVNVNNNVKTEYTNPWKFEDGNDGIIEAGETFIIFNYTAGSYAYGPKDAGGNKPYSMKHDTAENLAAAWDTFNEFYGISVPVENRVMSLSVDENGAAISGATALPERGESSVQIVNNTDGTVIAKADYARATLGLSHNYVQSKTETGKFLCVNGVSPYRLLHEQDVNYNPTFDFSGEKFRLVNYNLYFEDKEFEARAACFEEFLATYSPDIMGLEEIGLRWYEHLHVILPRLGYGYVEVNVQTGGTYPTYSGDSSNPFIYKLDKYDVLEYGTRFVTEDGTVSGGKWDCINRVRTVNYAVFQSKETGNKINVLATHGYLTGTQSKMEQVKLTKALALEMEAKHNCASAVMGDMNYDEGSNYYQKMLEGGSFVDTKYVAQTWSYRMTCALFGQFSYGATSYTNPWDENGCVIDIIYVSAGTQVKNYRVIDQAYYNAESAEKYPSRDTHISDHAAVLADLYI